MYAFLNLMSKEKHQLSYQGNTITYFIHYKNQKNTILRLIDNQIVVSAPFNTPIYLIEQFIYKHISKIVKVQNNYEFLRVYDFYTNKPWIKIFEKIVDIELVDQNIHPKKINNKIIIKNYYNNEIQLEKIYNFLAKEYKNWFINQTLMWAEKMNLSFENISVKVMKAKWGLCYSKKKNIIYNTKLLHFDPKIIDYVIVHELTHILYPNHSKDFWRYVATYLPNYQELQQILNSKGI
ncbi:M48 family peptidase [Mycoplasma feriruminatoris]|uniref:YgjP family zinc-dependent metalloprotease n=1 Tax=Mycoplasma feriruminatoris TaxID=1179777 RepID=UPI00241E3CBD|nr:SprT family zinc-dependent metalloprotease [Mycoplasma feriruminatoris]WFQ91373.1 M48 family peptidase [Mycoplasma feriruminatoris]